MRTLKAGAAYFLVVFGAGFVLGPIRILWVVPQLGMADLALRYEQLLACRYIVFLGLCSCRGRQRHQQPSAHCPRIHLSPPYGHDSNAFRLAKEQRYAVTQTRV